MSPAPRKKKDAKEPDVPVTPEADVASEDIEDVSPEEVAELDAEAVDAVEAEADEPTAAEAEPTAAAADEPAAAEAAPEVAEAPPSEAPAKAPKPRRRRTRAAKEDAPAAAKPTAPAPRRRRSQREPGQPAPVVRAQAKYVRSSARKARLVCDHIRGKSVDEARAILAHTPRAVARDWSKLLESAIANAEHNHELVGEDLYVKAVHADEGPTIRRFRPRAMGRATKIRKRTAHLTILLTPKD